MPGRFRGRSGSGRTVVSAEGFDDEKTRRELRRLERKYPEALAAAMFEEAVEIFGESQEEVPVDTGALRRSGLVFSRRMGDSIIVVISYGTAYAVRIHENTSLDEKRRHRAEMALSNPGYVPRGATTGKSKYLQDPFERAVPGMTSRLAARTRARAITRGNLAGELRTVRGKGK